RFPRGDRQVEMDIFAARTKERMGCESDDRVEIAASARPRGALAREPNAASVRETRRNAHVDRARLLDDLPARTDLRHRDGKRLRHAAIRFVERQGDRRLVVVAARREGERARSARSETGASE